MFGRISAFTVLALASSLVVAVPNSPPIPAVPGSPPASLCDPGNLHCCQRVSQANDPATAALLERHGIVVNSITVPIGVTCTPISVFETSGTPCTAQPVCCQNNSINGVVGVGCTPVNLSE